MARHAFARKDGTHDARKQDFLDCGCTVQDLHAVRIPGLPDLLVGCLGQNHLVETKDDETAYGRQGLNRNQDAFARHWNGGPVFVVKTQSHVVELVQLWRTRREIMR